MDHPIPWMPIYCTSAMKVVISRTQMQKQKNLCGVGLYLLNKRTVRLPFLANFDQPDIKARYTLSVTAPAEWELIANSAEAAREIKSLIGASVERVNSGSRLVADAGSTMTKTLLLSIVQT